jgi:hypothetical protein
MSRRDLSVKGGTSERCGQTDEQRYAIISPYFDGRIEIEIFGSISGGAVAIIRQSDNPIVRQSDSPTNTLN